MKGTFFDLNTREVHGFDAQTQLFLLKEVISDISFFNKEDIYDRFFDRSKT